MQITLINGYFIDIDEMNYTLRQEFVGKDKNGNSKVSVRTVGYYGKLEHAIEGFVKRNQIGEFGKKSVSLKEYVKIIEDINKKAVNDIMSVLDKE